MKYILLATIAVASLSVAACTNSANRGISPAAQTDTMTPNASSQVARPVQSGGGANVGVAQQGGSMSEPARGAQTTTVVSPARSDTGAGTMNDPAAVRPPR